MESLSIFYPLLVPFDRRCSRRRQSDEKKEKKINPKTRRRSDALPPTKENHQKKNVRASVLWRGKPHLTEPCCSQPPCVKLSGLSPATRVDVRREVSEPSAFRGGFSSLHPACRGLCVVARLGGAVFYSIVPPRERWRPSAQPICGHNTRPMMTHSCDAPNLPMTNYPYAIQKINPTTTTFPAHS